MQENFFFDGGGESRFKIYSIVKRERRPKGLLGPAPNFSWPPRKLQSRVSERSGRPARGEGEKK